MKSFLPVPLAVLLLLVLTPCETNARASGWEDLFFEANQAYRSGGFPKAIEAYNQLIRSGQENGHIYYNLGNAHFRLKRLGRAILNYEKALIFIPRDADLKFNLSYARDQTRDAVSESQRFPFTAFFWLKSLNLNELLWGFLILNGLFWTILVIRFFLRSEWTYYFFVILMIFWVISGASFGLKWYQIETDNRAVILAQEINIMAGPDSKDTVLFKLHEGTIVHQERSEDDWYLITLPDGKRGWIKEEALGLIT